MNGPSVAPVVSRNFGRSVPAQIIPFGQQYDAVGVEAHVLERVHGSDNLLRLEVDDGDRTVPHPRQVNERVLHEAVASVACQANMVCTLAGLHRFDQRRLGRVPRQIKDMQQARVGGGDVHGLAIVDKVHLQRHPAFDRRQIADGHIIVREAAAGERVTTLDRIERELPAGACVVIGITWSARF